MSNNENNDRLESIDKRLEEISNTMADILKQLRYHEERWTNYVENQNLRIKRLIKLVLVPMFVVFLLSFLMPFFKS